MADARAMIEAVRAISWLTGKWVCKLGEATFPTMKKPYPFKSIMEFEFIGQAMLNYKFQSCMIDPFQLSHLEMGFLRINPGTCDVSFVLAHNAGGTTIEEGVVCENVLALKTVHAAVGGFPKDPAFTDIQRVLTLCEKGNQQVLELDLKMATVTTKELTDHIKAVYEKAKEE